MRKINKAIKCFGILIMAIVIILVIISVDVNIKGNDLKEKINEFKNRSEYVGTYTLNTTRKETVSYYKVTKTRDYEINDDRRIYSLSYTSDTTQTFTDIKIGDVGDIYLTSSNPFGLMYTEWMSKKIYIGHAGIVNSDEASTTYESTGKGKEKGVHELENDWFSYDTNDLIIIRNKNNINKKEIQNWLKEVEDMKYNYLYFLKTKKRYYCTDLATRCYEESCDIKVTDKNIFVTGESIIDYEDNYIIYYREKSNEDNVDYNVYYLE